MKSIMLILRDRVDRVGLSGSQLRSSFWEFSFVNDVMVSVAVYELW